VIPLALPQIDSPPLVSIHDLWVKRGTRDVLAGVNADIVRGGITAVIGLNGSGKSTLLQTILGEFPYRGTLQFRCGHDHSHPRPEYVGYVPQRLAIDARLPITVRDLLGLAMNGRRPIFFGFRRGLRERMHNMLRLVGAEKLLDVPVDGLSGGQLQRVLLALALEPSPELLLLDEPAAGIDFQDLESFYEQISDFNRRLGVTVLLVSHDLQTVNRIATNVLCLRDGRIRAAGHPRDVLTPDQITSTFGHRVSTIQHKERS